MAIYDAKKQSQVLTSILNSLERNAGITAAYPGSIARAFAEAFSSEISDLYGALSFALTQSNLTTASGANLDLIGDLYGVTRKQVTNLVANERRSFNIEFLLERAHSTSVRIPSGTFVYNDVSSFLTKQYRYKLMGDVEIPSGSMRAYGRIEPDFYDNAYVAPRGSLTKHSFIAPPTVTVFCTNPKEVYSNSTFETDDNYRRRILASMKTRATGTAESIRFAALSVKGVRDVRIREASYGIGSCDIIVVPEVSSVIKALPQAILTAVSSVKPVGVRFNVRIAERALFNVSATITLGAGNTDNMVQAIRTQAELFVKRYLNSLSIGDTVSISALEREILNSSDMIRGVRFNAFSVDGKEIPLQDYNINTVKKYPVAGSVNIYSVIIGNTTY